jgi:WD40 repeat protein
VWRADGTGEPLELPGHAQLITAVAFSPDGKRVVAASKDRMARVWQADGTGGPELLPGHKKPLTAVAFSRDGKRVLTASLDGTVREWQADRTGKPLVWTGTPVWKWQTESLTAIAFSPDGQRVATASADGLVRTWPVSVAVIQQMLRVASTSCLSPELRQDYLDEKSDKASRKYMVCERDHGRGFIPRSDALAARPRGGS